MVYCRRPSKYCLGCRQRRIKCDLKLPACTQCMRLGMECTGYRDQLSLLFRDENARTQHRSITAKDRSRSAGNAQKELTHMSPQIGLPAVPSTSVDDYGLTFFMDRFTTLPKWMIGSGQSHISNAKIHPFINVLISKEPSRDGLISVGLAALSNVTGDKRYRTAAVQKYVTAINYARRTIAEPSNANLEVAIKLSVILTLYEFVNRSAGSDRSWNVHADGALALVRNIHSGRMPKKPQNITDFQAYLFFIMRYFGSGGNIPHEILNWSFPAYSSQVLNSTSELITILVRLVRLTAALRTSTSSMGAESVVKEAYGIDRDFNDWETGLADEYWSFATVRFGQPLALSFGLYQGKYHVYKNIWAARVLNHYRWARILVNEVLYTHILKMETLANSDLLQQQQHSALSTISRMATDICISVSSHSRLFGHDFSSIATGQDDIPPLNGIFLLVFPLVIAGSAIGIPVELHNWVIEILKTIDSTMGIRQAVELIPAVQRMRESQRAEYWSGARIW